MYNFIKYKSINDLNDSSICIVTHYFGICFQTSFNNVLNLTIKFESILVFRKYYFMQILLI